MAVHQYIYVSDEGFKFWVRMDESHALMQNGVRADEFLSIIGKWPFPNAWCRQLKVEWEDESRGRIIQLQPLFPPIGTIYPLRRKNTIVIGCTIYGYVGERSRPIIQLPNFA